MHLAKQYSSIRPSSAVKRKVGVPFVSISWKLDQVANPPQGTWTLAKHPPEAEQMLRHSLTNSFHRHTHDGSVTLRASQPCFHPHNRDRKPSPRLFNMAQAGNASLTFPTVWKHVDQQHNTAGTQFQSFLSSWMQGFECIFVVHLPYL